ncbi:unnamed protein product, partial [Ectocarpus sp. 12 AP-2014]
RVPELENICFLFLVWRGRRRYSSTKYCNACVLKVGAQRMWVEIVSFNIVVVRRRLTGRQQRYTERKVWTRAVASKDGRGNTHTHPETDVFSLVSRLARSMT